MNLPPPTTLRECRTPLGGRVLYQQEDPRDAGVARWRDVSRTGARIGIGRYLRPGRWITLAFDAPLVQGAQLEARARVVWCRPAEDGLTFEAGLCILREMPEMALDFAALGYRARRGANSPAAAGVFPAAWPAPEIATETKPAAGAPLPRAI